MERYFATEAAAFDLSTELGRRMADIANYAVTVWELNATCLVRIKLRDKERYLPRDKGVLYYLVRKSDYRIGVPNRVCSYSFCANEPDEEPLRFAPCRDGFDDCAAGEPVYRQAAPGGSEPAKP